MRALWSDRQNCSHNVSRKVNRIRRFLILKKRVGGQRVLAKGASSRDSDFLTPQVSEGGLFGGTIFGESLPLFAAEPFLRTSDKQDSLTGQNTLCVLLDYIFLVN